VAWYLERLTVVYPAKAGKTAQGRPGGDNLSHSTVATICYPQREERVEKGPAKLEEEKAQELS
jgi:hypothetical protein